MDSQKHYLQSIKLKSKFSMGTRAEQDCINEYKHQFAMKEEDNDSNSPQYDRAGENEPASPMIGLKIRKESTSEIAKSPMIQESTYFMQNQEEID